MNLFASVLAVIAAAVFLAEFFRSRSLLGLGLAVLTAAWVVQLVWQSGATVKVT